MTLLQCNEKKKSFVTVTTGPLKAVLEAVHVGEKKVEKPLPSRKQSYDAEMAKESAMIQTVKVQKEEEDKLVFLNAETRKKEIVLLCGVITECGCKRGSGRVSLIVPLC